MANQGMAHSLRQMRNLSMRSTSVALRYEELGLGLFATDIAALGAVRSLGKQI